MGLFSMSVDLAPESQKENYCKIVLKMRTITYNSEATISNCNTIQTEDNIQYNNQTLNRYSLFRILSIKTNYRLY